MKTAIITGASSGLGRELARQIEDIFPDIECYWLISRRADRLESLAISLPGRHTACLALDLCDPMSFVTLKDRLAAEKPEVSLLVNCAGCGYLVDLNVRALTAVTNIVLPYMPEGSHILNVSSIASFCPNPRMTVYSSTKAYVSHFTVGLAEELRRRKVSVTAVCPGPMATEFLSLAGITGHSSTFEFLPYCDQVKVAGGALRAAKAGRTIYTPKLFYKFYRLLAKVAPSQLLVKFVKT